MAILSILCIGCHMGFRASYTARDRGKGETPAGEGSRRDPAGRSRGSSAVPPQESESFPMSPHYNLVLEINTYKTWGIDYS